ncbi:MAG: peptidoglycan editing factor PgeF [Limnochordia bacterium]
MFAIEEYGDLRLMKAELLCEEWLFHAVTTRQGGVSSAPFDTLNVGLHVGDQPERVLENRRRICAAVDYDLQAWVSGEQVHGARCYHVTGSDAGRGAFEYSSAIPATDILITQTPGILLACLVADCVPVLLADPVNLAVGLVHCGWQGTLAGAAHVAVQTMSRAFGSKPADLMAVLGPGIGPCCYEVSEQLARTFQDRFGADVALGRMLDLRLANRRLLSAVGLSLDAIHTAPWCTRCQQELFFSHRGSGGKSGRMAALIGVRQAGVP